VYQDEFDRLKEAFKNLQVGDEAGLKRLRHETLNMLGVAVPKGKEADRYVGAVNSVWFHPRAFVIDDEGYTGPDPGAWAEGREEMVATIEGIQHHLRITATVALATPKAARHKMNRLFLVHGHDHPMLHEIEAFVRRIGLEPVVLMEEASRGDTVIEKVERYADVPFAIVLLSPDDVGRAVSDPTTAERLRPRQNAILEAGFFIGKLGRHNVTVVVDGARDAEAEYPSDLAGIVTVHYAPGGDWKTRLMREFKASDLIFDSSSA
jgi:predicted nucleotide-binding protein